MKIIQETPDTIIIKDKNILSFIIGIIFVVIGLGIVVKPEFFSEGVQSWIGIIGIVLGVFAIAVTKVITVTMDKTTGKCVWAQKSLMGKTDKEYPLDKIKEVELTTSYSYTHRRSGKNSGGYTYHVNLVMKDGSILELNPGVSQVRTLGWQMVPENKLGTRIAQFLNVPFQERRSPTVTEALSTVSSAIQDAIAKSKNDKE